MTSKQSIFYSDQAHPVVRTVSDLLRDNLGLKVESCTETPDSGILLGLQNDPWALQPEVIPDENRPWCYARIAEDGGMISASDSCFLYAFVHWLVEQKDSGRSDHLQKGILNYPTFEWHRPLFDLTLTQTARSVRNFDAESYIKQLARCGMTHVEVNGLATHIPLEPGVPNEFYAQFYSYGPGLNQFVESPLTQGIYPIEYLTANLNRLKKLAALGRKYGLKPGMVCYEPRTLPEHFFHRYPTLRGARVDHPFRSHLPRYTLAQDHPVAQEHYRILLQNLMRAVPDLAYLSVWSNDSGSGFEHTASLYVGRNGGPYMIREWRNHDKIAQAAGSSAVRFLSLLQESAAAFNPDFEVILRIEPFKVEHDHILNGMGEGVSFEAPSLLVRGYHLPYSHPRYPEQESVAGSIFHTAMDESEVNLLDDYRTQGIEPKLTYSVGTGFNMEPLLGIPFPVQLYRKLRDLRRLGIRQIGALGGLLHLDKTPYWPHPDVIRAVHFTPERSIDEILLEAASRWVSEDQSGRLVNFWTEIDEAVSYFPQLYLYSHFGFVWLRTWVRPFIPNLEAPPKEERQYYERFMVSTPNNPSINDLGKDVLFDLITLDAGRKMMQAFDEHVVPRLTGITNQIRDCVETSSGTDRAVFIDLLDRVRALRCWALTQRNTCAWVAGVHGYLEAQTDTERESALVIIRDMMDSERANALDLLDLWETSSTEFMLVSDVGETSYIYGENFGELVRRKIELMERYRDVEPFIDQDIIWRLV